MPSSPYTDIPHIETGASQKEVVHNAGIDQVDGELNGLLAKTLTSADVTLSAVEALFNFYVRVTGAFTANRNLIVPVNKKVYAVEMAGTGGYSLTVKTAAGSGVALINGETRILYCNGTNVVAVTPVAGVSDQAYDVYNSLLGMPPDGEIIQEFPVVRGVKFPAGLVNAYAYADVAPTANATFDIRHNGTSFGSFTIAAGAHTGSFSSGSDETLVAGDRFAVVAPSPQDATLSGLSYGIGGVRV